MLLSSIRTMSSHLLSCQTTSYSSLKGDCRVLCLPSPNKLPPSRQPWDVVLATYTYCVPSSTRRFLFSSTTFFLPCTANQFSTISCLSESFPLLFSFPSQRVANLLLTRINIMSRREGRYGNFLNPFWPITTLTVTDYFVYIKFGVFGIFSQSFRPISEIFAQYAGEDRHPPRRKTRKLEAFVSSTEYALC